jgi:hypothetical protein
VAVKARHPPKAADSCISFHVSWIVAPGITAYLEGEVSGLPGNTSYPITCLPSPRERGKATGGEPLFDYFIGTANEKLEDFSA